MTTRQRSSAALLLFIAGVLPQHALAQDENPRTGFPIANFGIGAEVAPSGKLLGRVVYNPPKLGEWLEDVNRGAFSFEVGGVRLRDEELHTRQVDRRWPLATARLSDERLPGTSILFEAFAPVVAGDAFGSSLPVVLAELTFSNQGDSPASVTAEYRCLGSRCPRGAAVRSGKVWLAEEGLLAVAADSETQVVALSGSVVYRWIALVKPHKTTRLRLVLARYHDNGFYAAKLKNTSALVGHAFANWDRLRRGTQKFADGLPRLEDQVLDDSLRWYMTAAVLLTRLTRAGETLTMGYAELNQRDSYWTSFPHLVYWPDLERKMLEESGAAVRADGMVPSTILPDIVRDDGIDINCYFVMRAFRWAAYKNDLRLLRQLWPGVKRALGYVQAADSDGDGLPEQRSHWADWKDVPGVKGRKHGPHFVLLWLAAVHAASEWAEKLADGAASRDYALLYARGLASANRPVAEGGLWNGSHYVTVWSDGRRDDRVLEDQVVGIAFGVVDKQRADSIYKALAGNEGQWGVRETYPYYPSSFGYRPGDYHNGAVWPFLNFVDALSRYRQGRGAEATRILKKVATADLFARGDFLPHENIDGETGENTRHYLQAWNADFFAAIYFGMLHPELGFYAPGKRR